MESFLSEWGFVQYVWAGLFLLVEGVMVYGVIHGILNRQVRNHMDAVRFNERVRYAASALNTLAVGMVAGVVILPVVNNGSLTWWAAYWGLAGVALHLMGQLLFGLLKKEDGYE